MEAASGIFIIGIWLVMLLLGLGSVVFWIYTLVEVVKIPEPVWQHTRDDKIVWVLVIALLGWLGALVYWIAVRGKLQRAKAWFDQNGYPPPVYGGYPPQQQPPPGNPPAQVASGQVPSGQIPPGESGPTTS